MSKQPVLETKRLILRPFTLDDAPTVYSLVSDKDIASTTLNIPYPYEEGMAEAWIGTHEERFESGQGVSFAIVQRSGEQQLVGAIGMQINDLHQRAEMGYWIGKPYWNKGYATEAVGAMLRYGFTERGLNRMMAMHLTRNPASGRGMQKNGMVYEGRLREHSKKWDVFEDLDIYSLLRNEYFAA